ncbi:MAG: aminodeoxychorismate synthase component I [Gemmatimonadota bacterium]
MAPLVIQLGAAPEPIEALSRFAGWPEPRLLHSAAHDHPLSRYSFVSADPVSTIAADAAEWPAVRERIRGAIAHGSPAIADLPPFQGGWLGWFGYELGSAFDEITRHRNEPLPIPDVVLGLHDWVIAWDHQRGETWLISTGIDAAGNHDAARAGQRSERVMQQLTAAEATGPVSSAGNVTPMQADFTEATYLAAVSRVIEYVLAGDIFQANLAQRFTVPFSGDALALYRHLTMQSPAPMGAYLQHGAIAVASASPERFLRFDAATRQVETRPIKGTRPRDSDPGRDAAAAAELAASEKDRAENVMIVDLLRNDLSRVCLPGTVHAPTLCALESHATVHHLVSTVVGELRPECDAVDLLAASFPGGSITGAPKLRAMEIIREIEPVARGVYSGAIAWIGLDGSMDTSIVIRTIAIVNGIAALHAGGGITAMSSQAEEYQETLDKAAAPLAAIRAAQ